MNAGEPGRRPSLLEHSPAELERRFVELGARPFHARVARGELLGRGVLDYGAMSALPAALRARLAEEIPLLSGAIVERTRSADGTTKLLIEFPSRGGSAVRVETVHIPPRAARPSGSRGATLCVSSQAGCPVGCPFCASGLAGLDRNLSAHEIVEQYLLGRSLGPLSRSVVMGIGEPLLNYRNLRAALEVVNGELGLGARRVTVSSVGFPDRVRRAARERPPFELAISLHSPDDEQRDELVPAMRGTPVEEVLEAGQDWFRATGREPTWEYALLGGRNTSDGHADRLAARLAGRRGSVNLIPYNPSPGLPFDRPAPRTAEAFRDRLRAAGIVATIRWSRGLDGAAACGQLRHALRAAGSSAPASGPAPAARAPGADLGADDPPS